MNGIAGFRFESTRSATSMEASSVGTAQGPTSKILNEPKTAFALSSTQRQHLYTPLVPTDTSIILISVGWSTWDSLWRMFAAGGGRTSYIRRMWKEYCRNGVRLLPVASLLKRKPACGGMVGNIAGCRIAKARVPAGP